MNFLTLELFVMSLQGYHIRLTVYLLQVFSVYLNIIIKVTDIY